MTRANLTIALLIAIAVLEVPTCIVSLELLRLYNALAPYLSH